MSVLRYSLYREGSRIFFRVLEQSEDLRTGVRFESHKTGLVVRSSYVPELALPIIYIRGENKDRDNDLMSRMCDSPRHAELVIVRIQDTLEEFMKEYGILPYKFSEIEVPPDTFWEK